MVIFSQLVSSSISPSCEIRIKPSGFESSLLYHHCITLKLMIMGVILFSQTLYIQKYFFVCGLLFILVATWFLFVVTYYLLYYVNDIYKLFNGFDDRAFRRLASTPFIATTWSQPFQGDVKVKVINIMVCSSRK